jgi:hypothetical protein
VGWPFASTRSIISATTGLIRAFVYSAPPGIPVIDLRHEAVAQGGGPIAKRCAAIRNPVMTGHMIHRCPIAKAACAERLLEWI